MKKEKLKAIGMMLFIIGFLANIGDIFFSEPLTRRFYFFLFLSIIGIILFFYASSKK